MKKVLMVTRPIVPPWDEASKNFAYNLAIGINDFKVSMLTPGRVDGLDKNIEQLPIYSDAHLSIGQKIKLAKLYAKRNDYDIIHFLLTPNKMNVNASKFIFKNSRAKIIQTIATVRDDLYNDVTLGRLFFGDALITYSDYAKQKLEALGYTNVTRIYPGIDFNYYKPAEKNSSMLREYNLSESDYIVSYPGEYVRLGVTDTLVDILPELIKEIPNLKFIFACRIKNDNDQKKKLMIQEHFRSLGIHNNIVYTDTVKDMASLYNISDAVLFPVKQMTGKFDVPLSIIEAMACGKPVIATDLPVLREFLSSDNSIVISSDNLSNVKEAILDVHGNPEEKVKIGENARRFVVSNFNIESSRKAYEKIYERVSR